jgi:putative ABC transport system ATP-binding protein
VHRNGNTVVLVTHEEDIAANAERIVRLRDGKIESDQLTSRATSPASRRAATVPKP